MSLVFGVWTVWMLVMLLAQRFWSICVCVLPWWVMLTAPLQWQVVLFCPKFPFANIENQKHLIKGRFPSSFLYLSFLLCFSFAVFWVPSVKVFIACFIKHDACHLSAGTDTYAYICLRRICFSESLDLCLSHPPEPNRLSYMEQNDFSLFSQIAGQVQEHGET